MISFKRKQIYELKQILVAPYWQRCLIEKTKWTRLVSSRIDMPTNNRKHMPSGTTKVKQDIRMFLWKLLFPSLFSWNNEIEATASHFKCGTNLSFLTNTTLKVDVNDGIYVYVIRTTEIKKGSKATIIRFGDEICFWMSFYIFECHVFFFR